MPPAARDEVVWVDPLVWAREILKELQSRRLGDVAKHLGVPLEQAHRAAGDAEATGRVLLGLAQQMPRVYGGARASSETVRRVSGTQSSPPGNAFGEPRGYQSTPHLVSVLLMALGSWAPVLFMWSQGIEWSGAAGRAAAIWYTVPALLAVLFVPGPLAQTTDPCATWYSSLRQPLVGHRVARTGCHPADRRRIPVAGGLIRCSRSNSWSRTSVRPCRRTSSPSSRRSSKTTLRPTRSC